MKRQIKYFIVIKLLALIILSDVIGVLAQSRTNPFEIKPRLKEISQIADTSSTKPNVSDTSSSEIIKTDTITSSLDTSASTESAFSKNPFEVDHVPIRRSIVDKKSEDIKTITESTKGSTRFLFFFLILGCAILAIVLGINRKIITLISKSLVNENILKLFYREDLFKPSTFLLYFIYLINFSAFIYLISIYYGGPSGIQTYGLIMLAIILIYLVRHLSLFTLGIIFPVSRQTRLFSFTVMVFNQFIGLMLIPINLFLALGPSEYRYHLIIFSMFLLAFIYILRSFRGIFIVSEYFVERFFQIIIYLCAFEIVPVLILWKTISNFVE